MKIQDHRAGEASGPSSRPPGQLSLIFWVIWASILAGSVVIHFTAKRVVPAGLEGGVLDWFGLVPLLGSVVVRWLVLPRFTEQTKALPIFVVGLALAEAATIVATFLATGAAYRLVAVAGMLGIAMWAPLFVKNLTPPRPR